MMFLTMLIGFLKLLRTIPKRLTNPEFILMVDWLPKQYRYVDFYVDTIDGRTLVNCLGFYFFHIYWETDD